MPLYLRAPRKATHSYEIRGTYLGVAVERSTGTRKRSVALTKLGELERAIEAGDYPPRQVSADPREPTFLSAAVSYMQQGGERRYVGPLLRHFGEALLPLSQEAVDAAALALRPNAGAATRNHVGLEAKLRRPKGAKGKVRMDWLTEADASAIIKASGGDMALLLTF